MNSDKLNKTSALAAEVQTGQADILTLWAAVYRFTEQQAQRWCRAFDGRSGVTLDDLIQTAFIALLQALKTWKRDRWSFLTVYGGELKKAFTVTCGVRTQRDKQDPLNNYPIPLDEPVSEDEDLTLSDTIRDENSLAAFEEVEREDLERAVQAALASLTEEQRSVIIAEFWYGNPVRGKTRSTALRRLRHPSVSRELRKYWL